MADDKNKPNQSDKPINGNMPRRLEESFAKRERTIGSRYETHKYEPLTEKFYDLVQEEELYDKSSQEYRDLIEKQSYLKEQFERLDESFSRTQNKQLAEEVSTYTRMRNVNERTTTMSGESRFFKGAKESKDIYLPTETLESRISTKQERVTELGQDIAGRARGLGTGQVDDFIKSRAAEIQQLQEDIALDKRIMKTQSRQGLSTEKMYNKVEDVLSRSEAYFEDKSLEEKIREKQLGTLEDAEKQMAFRQAEVMGAQQRYEKAKEDKLPDDELKEFSEALIEATKGLEDQQKVVGEMKRQGYGGPPDLGLGDIGRIVSMGGRAAAVMARGTQDILVQQRTEQIGYKAQFAERANRIYARGEEAIMGGNMDALLELTGGGLSRAKEGADFAKTATNVTEGVAQVGDAAVGVGNTMQAVKEGLDATGYIGALTGAGTVAAAAPAVSQGLIEGTNAIVKGTRLTRGLYGAPESLRRYDTELELDKQVRNMDSRMKQAVYNQGMTTYNSVTGLGNAGGVQAAFMDTDTLSKMAESGLTPEKAAQLTAGMRAAGAMSAQDAVDVVQRAGVAKQKGILGQEEYVGMAAQLMGAGGETKDLEDIMASAVASGMDNSKSISELVSGTLMMSQGLGAMGISATGSSQALLSRASENLIKGGVDPNLAVGASLQSMQNYQAIQTSNEFNMGNIIERSGLRQINSNFVNANASQMDVMQKMSAADHKILMDAARAKGDTPEDKAARARADQLLKQKGLTEILNPNGEGVDEDVVKRMVSLSAVGSMVNMGALGQKGIDVKAISSKLASGEELTDKETALLANYNITAGTAAAANRLDDPSRKNPNSKANLQGVETERVQGRFRTRELEDAEKVAGANMQEVFKSLETTLSGLQENLGPEKIKEEMAKAAENFEQPSLTFKKGTEEFSKAVAVFVQNQNKLMERISENQVKPNIQKTLDQNKRDFGSKVKAPGN